MAILRSSFMKLPPQKPDVPIRGGERGHVERVQARLITKSRLVKVGKLRQ
jgi:hypothetical protein